MAKKLWGGRFTKKTDPMVEQFTGSLKTDFVLAKYDVLGSIAHARMLGKCGIIPKKDADKIVKGLKAILKDLDNCKIKVDFSIEDVHTLVQDLLEKKIGPVAKKVHTARSRNDQVSLDTRMFCRDFICALINGINNLHVSLGEFVSKNKQVKKLPGYTHLQHAQPIDLNNYAGAYKAMLERDKERLEEIYKRVNVLPLGSCALAGTTLPIDRKFVAKELGFSSVMQNTIDAVSDRDFVIEILGACAILGMHLSRLSEDFIIWSSSEFNFINIDEAFCTGSSIMPQKKNPDVLEMIRGGAGKLYGNLVSVLVLMKGLPLSYNRDMQFDKEPLFDSLKTVTDELLILAKLVKTAKLNKSAIDNQLKDPGLYATKLAEDLVKKGVAFKDAHRIIGEKIKQGKL